MGVKISNPAAHSINRGLGLDLAIQVIAAMGKPELDKLIAGIGKEAAPVVQAIKASCETWLKKKKIRG